MLLNRAVNRFVVFLFTIFFVPCVRAQSPAPVIRYEVQDLGSGRGEWVRAEGAGPDGTAVGQAHVVRLTPPTMAGLTNSRFLSYFDRDSGFADRQMVDVLSLAYLLANPRLVGRFYSGKRRDAEDRMDVQRGVQVTPPRPVETPVLLIAGRVRELPTPEDRGGIALDTAQGIAVGAVRYSPVSDTLHAFAWIPERGDFRSVDLEGKKARGDSIAAAVNASGVIVGGADTGEGILRAFRWTGIAPDDTGILSPRQREELGTLGGPRSTARAISDSGQIVGWAETAPGQAQAFSWTVRDKMRPLETPADLPPTTQTEAVALDDAGTTVGVAFLPNGTRRAVVWTSRSAQVLPLITGTDSAEATALSASGLIVGAAFNKAAASQTPNAPAVALDLLHPPDVAAVPASTWAVLWSNGAAYDLNTLIPPRSGWILSRATGITPRGDIIGWGTFRGQVRAFRLHGRE